MSEKLRGHLSQIERGALEAWYVLFEIRGQSPRDPTEPTREKGGAFDPAGWCMKAAHAIASEKQPPRINKDWPCPGWAAERIRDAMLRGSGGSSGSAA